jgi:hypothetical protein
MTMAKKKLFRFHWPIPPLLTGYLVVFLLLLSFITWIVFFRSPLKDAIYYTAAPIQKISTSSGQTAISPDDFFPQYLTAMGIQSIGIPKSWGKPHIESDMKREDDGLPSVNGGYLPKFVTGRYIEIELGNSCYLQYTSNDFGYPSEFILLSRPNDYQDIVNKKIQMAFRIDGKPAIIRNIPLIDYMGYIAQGITIPFPDHGISVWCEFPMLSNFADEDWNTKQQQRFDKEEFTSEELVKVKEITTVAKTIRFIK